MLVCAGGTGPAWLTTVGCELKPLLALGLGGRAGGCGAGLRGFWGTVGLAYPPDDGTGAWGRRVGMGAGGCWKLGGAWGAGGCWKEGGAWGAGGCWKLGGGGTGARVGLCAGGGLNEGTPQHTMFVPQLRYLDDTWNEKEG